MHHRHARLGPASTASFAAGSKMDGRVKPGHDGGGRTAAIEILGSAKNLLSFSQKLCSDAPILPHR
jgi:hypothetical protein